MATSLKFYLNKAKRSNKTGKTPLYLRVIHDGKKAEGKINLPPVEEKEELQWNEEFQRFARGMRDHNAALDALKVKFDKFLSENIDNPDLSQSLVRDHLLMKNSTKVVTLSTLIDEYLQKVLVSSSYKWGTKRNKRKSMNHLLKFIAYKKHKELRPSAFTKQMAFDFREYLLSDIPEHSKKGLKDESAASVVKEVKAFFNFLLER